MSEEINESWEDEEKEVAVCKAKKESAVRMLEYLKYSEITSYIKESEDEDAAEIIVPESEAEKARQYLAAFLVEEKKRALDETNEDLSENIFSSDDFDTEEEVFEVNAQSHAYQTSSEKYNASLSSAFAFMLVGTAALVIIALVYCNIINLPIRFSDNPLLAVVLPIMAVAFEIIGVLSWRQAQKYRSEIGSEEQFDTDIKEWFLNKYTAEDIDKLCVNDIEKDETVHVSLMNKVVEEAKAPEDVETEDAETSEDMETEEADETKPEATDFIPEEIRFLQRLESIEKIINQHYPNLDKGYVDVLGEELYQNLFDKQA